ncbi:RuBisCO large subunit C-terminal-like domain-containing protein [Mucisphaera calidilacus]|uniref:2,3-diketo-5-methylthiopentyl-1-phosphate enolase n=1 Tax=Mucisphaera calidilacus TaxID=2527982 RepID=A0A518BZX2_9BACT|nr:RuBisCO large subunit C-terminal-like domain-containing protein [Mucisphaera calidilacus]QDU72527.1 2,3-diketo-5-methylthiopentyl-1-phosphate enolase [Mucisphaera calidilacus]
MIQAVYQLSGSRTEAASLADKVALEQSLEVPRSVAEAAGLPAGTIGEVVSLEPAPDSAWLATVHYATWLASRRPSQLLNLLGGNCSMLPGVRLVDVTLPDELTQHFAGPRYGIPGLRGTLGIAKRPLLCSAIKPRGVSNERLAEVAGAMALGGCDLIKDDHNLVDEDAQAFATRISTIQRAVRDAQQQTGRPCLYLPNLAAGPTDWADYLKALENAGIQGVLLAPMLMGFDAVAHLRTSTDLLLMAHPTLAGGPLLGTDHGIAPAVLLGTLMRLVGIDASVFPNAGGRFAFTQKTCMDLAHALRRDDGPGPGAWPTPAGGMSVDRIDEQAEIYGPETCWLVGGAMLQHPDGIERGAAELHEALVARFGDERTDISTSQHVSACEVPMPDGISTAVHTVLRRLESGWEDRHAVDYKADDALPFQGVKRYELMGKADEPMHFDVRYFELEPGGHTSREKHRHVHAIIAAEGRGEVEIDGQTSPLDAHDLAYIPPLAVHQIRNRDDNTPFGFYCIVDRDRDRPQAP